MKVIFSPDSGPNRMLNFYARIGIRERAKDEEKSLHGGSYRLCPAPSGERDPGGGDHPLTGEQISREKPYLSASGFHSSLLSDK